MSEPADPQENDAVRRLRRLAKKSGLSLFGLPGDDRNAVLAACQQFCSSKPFPVSEPRFTGYATEWLDRTHGFLRTDAAELRRSLVDFGFVRRDAAGTMYTLAPPFLDSGGSDLTGVIIAIRAEERAARDLRKTLNGGA